MPIQILFFNVCGKQYRTPILTWLFAIIIFCSGSQSLAQNNQCDQQLTPTPDNIGYKFRKNRCEGLYVSPVSGHGGLELVSLTKGRLHYELKPGKHLTLEVASNGLEPSTILVRGIARPLRTYYRMDTQLSTGQSWRWPIDEVLLPLQLTANRLGIFAWTIMPSGKIFVPVRVNRSTFDDIYLLVRPTVSVQDVIWRLSNPIAGQKHTTSWHDVAAQALAGETIPILLTGVDRGLLFVEVAAVVENGSWAKLRMKVWNE